ncbi:MAG: DNA/RNA nuclease SfsA, partial [Candidatus Thiodiazotropha taylori]|nr:DNA/RNA nuclease SfsA [Candidatus Thiodiazotropha taylori]MCW4257132.1 DNA/RNA nuclease SfsA [Candidatus Thiodiazotropha taylori]
RKHLQQLAQLCDAGQRGVMIYALNRPEGDCFKPADHIDPEYAEVLRQVVERSGVELMALRIGHSDEGMKVTGEVPIRLD